MSIENFITKTYGKIEKIEHSQTQQTNTLSSILKTQNLLLKETQRSNSFAAQESKNAKKAAQKSKRGSADSPGKVLSNMLKKDFKDKGKGSFFDSIKEGIAGLFGNIAGWIGIGGLGALGIGGILAGGIAAWINRDWIKKNILDPIGKIWNDTVVPWWDQTGKPWVEKNIWDPMKIEMQKIANDFVDNLGQIVGDMGNTMGNGISNAFNHMFGGSRATNNRTFNTAAAQNALGDVQGQLNDSSITGAERDRLLEEKKVLEELTRRTQKSRELENKIIDYEAAIREKEEALRNPSWHNNNPASQAIMRNAIDRGQKELVELRQQLVAHQQETQRIASDAGMLETLTRRSGFQRRQNGGPITVPGTGSGDKIPMMLAPGSFVLNREASRFQTGGAVPTLLEPGEKVYAPGTWGPGEALMNSLIPRFQNGGVVEYITGDRSHSSYAADHGGDNYHEHLGFSSQAARDRAIAALESSGFYIGHRETGRHADGSLHYSGQAVDIPFYPNHTRFGYSDDRAGEEKFSADVRRVLREMGMPVSGAANSGAGYSASNQGQNQTRNQDQSSSGGFMNMLLNGFDMFGEFAGQFGAPGRIAEAFVGMGGALLEGITPEIKSGFMSVLGQFQSAGQGLFDTSGNGGGNSEPLSGDQSARAKEIYDYLVNEKNLSDAHARGLIANMIRESSLNASVRSGDDGGPGGLFQWRGGRQTSAVAALVNSGDWKGQIDYALSEPESLSGVAPGAYQAMSFSSPQQAADWWDRNWERSADAAHSARRHSEILAGMGFQNGGVVPAQKLQTGGLAGVQHQTKLYDKFAKTLGQMVEQGGGTTIINNMNGGGGSHSGGGSGATAEIPHLPDSTSVPASAAYYHYLSLQHKL